MARGEIGERLTPLTELFLRFRRSGLGRKAAVLAAAAMFAAGCGEQQGTTTEKSKSSTSAAANTSAKPEPVNAQPKPTSAPASTETESDGTDPNDPEPDVKAEIQSKHDLPPYHYIIATEGTEGRGDKMLKEEIAKGYDYEYLVLGGNVNLDELREKCDAIVVGPDEPPTGKPSLVPFVDEAGRFAAYQCFKKSE